MREIVKDREPASLAEHRSKAHASYDNYDDKEALRSALVREQRGLCCYCLSRIRPNQHEMKIEHWHCQSRYPAEALDYSNLLGACYGNEGQPRTDQHCDTHKGDVDLTRNPANHSSSVGELVRFLPNGRISSTDEILERELNNVLNLNVPILVNNRAAALRGFMGFLSKRKHLPRAAFQRLLEEWNGDVQSGDLRPFCQVIVYWLRKRLERP